MKVGLIVPTLNAGPTFESWLEAYAQQTFKPDYALVIDSSSEDETAARARARGFTVEVIRRETFNHGTTRDFGVSYLSDADILIFLTQDALLADPHALENLTAAFADPQTGAAYGRQLPHRHAQPIGAHARLFNYAAQSSLRRLEDRARFGLKTAFVSNSFAAYRRTALLAVGGFPHDTIMNEDTYAVGKMLLAGWQIAYCADARVFHSHDYGFAEEFRRYFDIGVFHAREPWLRQTFGQAEGEGRRYVRSELAYLCRHAPFLVPSAVLRTALKWSGYKLGCAERLIPPKFKPYLSLHRRFWRDPRLAISN